MAPTTTLPTPPDTVSARTAPGTTGWEKVGAASGMFAVALLGLQYYLMQGATADPTTGDAAYATALLAERATWEWITFLRLVGGLTLVWSMGSLMSRLRLAEGEPGRLAGIAFALAALWGMVWLLSAFLNSAAILLAADYANPAGARLAGTLATEVVFVLSPSIVYTLILAVSFATLRFGGFPRAYAYGTTALQALLLALALWDWWGPGTLSMVIVGLGLAWLFVTSALLVPAWVPDDLVRGGRVGASGPGGQRV